MATYYDIFGQKVQYLSSDPANLTEGQVWYNSTSNTAKVQGYGTDSWATGPLMGAGRYQMNGQNVGTSSSALAIGGQGSFPETAPAVTVSSVEEYNGSSWSEVNNFPTTLAMAGSVGIQTAALQFGGYGKPGAGPNPVPGSPPLSVVNDYDGTSWTAAAANLPTAVAYLTGAGTQIAAVSIGGFPAITSCNLYNGATWASTGSMTTGRHNGSAVGDSTSALVIGGAPGGVNIDVEEFNGSTWTSSPNLPLAKEQAGVGGITTNAFASFGNQTSPTNTLLWDGTSWTAGATASIARYGGTNGGSSTSEGYYAGGGGSASGTLRQSLETYTFAGPTTQTITTS